jgi:hypothetical protein
MKHEILPFGYELNVAKQNEVAKKVLCNKFLI